MIALELEFPHLADKLRTGMRKVEDEIVVAMQTNRGQLFDFEGAYNGHNPWKGLILRSGQILSHRGVLKKSFSPHGGTGKGSGQPGPGGYVNRGDGVITMGTNVAYAALMNFGTVNMPGGVLRPTHAKALRIPLPSGKSASDIAEDIAVGQRRNKVKKLKGQPRFIFAKWVKIPERRFDTITSYDSQDFAAAAEAALAEVMRG